MSVSHIVPDATLTNWLLEAINYESFIYTLSRYEQELLYHKALDFELRLWQSAEQDYPENERGSFETYGIILEKLRKETYYENSQELRKILSPLIKSNAKKLPEATVNYSKSEFSLSIEMVQDLYDLLKLHFDANDHISLKNRLDGKEDGDNKLLFNNDGKKLANAFRQLYDTNSLRGSKIELEKWIERNFQYRGSSSKGEVKDFTSGYLNDIISTNGAPCKDPLLGMRLVSNQWKIEPTKRTGKKSSTI